MSLNPGSIELTLIYGKPGELGRTTEPQTFPALLQRLHSCFSVLLLPAEIGVALLKAPGLTRARIKQSDGTLIEGTVRCVQQNYFELVEDHQPA
ncbi:MULTISPECIES: hypothetical protein [Pseudomonas]|uniref:Uncharacterized protein n=1 Tax=Pseudomonas wuhanensis TaxID=2954098 RepID=A0ABY9GVF1_9PSED|nr:MULTISPECIES: hypothetical protein [unclassified Pseudomonas]WLI13884.1 hypothetical protein PSH65_07020 [Pseudomonas sp. FP603]WLI19782.1 hypothetical protein PSH88_07025 [Pseudomonas sp. FP607]